MIGARSSRLREPQDGTAGARPPSAVNGHYACDGFSRTETVRDALTEAIVARRLSPGARLPEIAIGEVFGVSRTIVREALGRLAGQGLVELKPNRGAFVAAPGAEEGREAFIVRRGLERTVIECLAGRLTQSQIGELQAFVSRETIAAGSEGACGDQFRLLLVKLTGNRTLMRYMAETVSRCALVQARREDPVDVVRVGPTGHTAVVEALIAGDSLTAARLMDEELTASFASPKIARRERPSRASPKKPANIRQIWPPEARQARV